MEELPDRRKGKSLIQVPSLSAKDWVLKIGLIGVTSIITRVTAGRGCAVF